MQKIRRYELLFILSSMVLFTIRQLIEFTRAFENDISFAKSSDVPLKIILQDFGSYNHFLNSIFPEVASVLLFAAAWYVFHYLAFPKIKELYKTGQYFDFQSSIYLFITILLVSGSVFVYSYFKLYWRIRFNGLENMIGFKVYSDYRNLHIFINTLAGLVIILLYEFIAQVYYYTLLLQEKSNQTKHKILSYVILLSVVLCIFIWVLAGRKAIDGIGYERILPVGAVILLSFAFHLLIFYKIFPFFTKIGKTTFEKIAFRFLGFAGYFLITGIVFSLLHHEGIPFLILYLFPTLTGFFSALIRWYFFVENKQLQTQVFQKSAELSTLRSQINPHFLFNALNTLYAVALKENAEKTSNGIQKLGDMMRFMLHENHQDRIPLSKEVEYLQNFIEIQRMRLDESQNIEIRVNLQEPEREIYVAPMLLNPFVENAFKHGISFRNPSWIYITLTLDSQKIYFKVHNSIHSKTENDPEENKSGVGLENVRKRLDLIYPNRHKLEIQESEQDYFASLTLTYW